MELLLIHARWFPRQLQQFLQTLGQKVVALLIAVVMPIVFWLGLGGQPRAKVPLAIQTQALLCNLIDIGLPAESYQEVPQRTACNRRGLWEEIRPGGRLDEAQIEQVIEQFTAVEPLPISVLLPNVDLLKLQSDSKHSYQTILLPLNLADWH